MAEENTQQEVEDEPSSEAAEAAADTGGDSQESAAENTASGEDDSTANADTPEAADAETESADDVPADVTESANEPTIGQEIPSTEATRVSDANGNAIVEPITDISMLLDIPVTLSMEIGQTKISINELLKLGKDSVIELQRMAHEPLDVLVNGTLVAHGEAVVVGDRFGIRLTDVISPQERLRKFG